MRKRPLPSRGKRRPTLLALLFVLVLALYILLQGYYIAQVKHDDAKKAPLEMDVFTEQKESSTAKRGDLNKDSAVHGTQAKMEFVAPQNLDNIEIFAAAWWQSVARFLPLDVDQVVSPATASFVPILRAGGGKKDARMPQDWLDFCVEHLSHWWRQAGQHGASFAIGKLQGYTDRVMTSDRISNMMLSTIAVIPHGDLHPKRARSADPLRMKQIRITALSATIASLIRHGIGRVVVVGHFPTDAEDAERAFRPLYRHNSTVGKTQLTFIRLNAEAVDNGNAVKANIPYGALAELQRALKGEMNKSLETAWLGEAPQQWKYIYFTEDDQILNARPLSISMHELLDEGRILIPQRLQPIPHPLDFAGVVENPKRNMLPETFNQVYSLNPYTDRCCNTPEKYDLPSLKCGSKWWMCGFNDNSNHSLLESYEFFRLEQGTGIVSLAATGHSRKCVPAKNKQGCEGSQDIGDVHTSTTTGALVSPTRKKEAVSFDSGAAGTADAPSPSPVPSKGGKTLALLYPPGLIGGYRNQVIRLTGLVVYAMKNNFTEILLPSLIWNTKFEGSEAWVPVPHDMLFDVDVWNSMGEDLPRLVGYNNTKQTDWKIPVDTSHHNKLLSEVLSRGYLWPIVDYAADVARGKVVINPRKVDLLQNVSQCQRPAVYGGGLGAGRLWEDYNNIHNGIKERRDFPFEADAKIIKVLQPRQEFREVAQQCVRDGAGTKEDRDKPYVALHARVELEMMGHFCGRMMEMNLTKIFNMVDELVKNDLAEEDVEGVFIAVSRSGIETKEGWYSKFQKYADENVETLNRVVGTSTTPGSGLRHGGIPVFECGRSAVQRFYESFPEKVNLGSLLDSMVDFQVATEATAFVGVRGSSFSTDIWTKRYHLGKGRGNYEYTKEGIKLIENGGLPPAHTNCK